MEIRKISILIIAGVVVGCANPVLVDMLGVECLSAAFSGVSALRGLAALLGDHPANHYRSACHFPIFVYMFMIIYIHKVYITMCVVILRITYTILRDTLYTIAIIIITFSHIEICVAYK